MTNWTFKKTPKNNILIFQKEESQPEIFVGEAAGLHIALTEVASFFKPEDIVTTPEGKCIVAKTTGELNN
jgi:hypothetical protein